MEDGTPVFVISESGNLEYCIVSTEHERPSLRSVNSYGDGKDNYTQSKLDDLLDPKYIEDGQRIISAENQTTITGAIRRNPQAKKSANFGGVELNIGNVITRRDPESGGEKIFKILSFKEDESGFIGYVEGEDFYPYEVKFSECFLTKENNKNNTIPN